MTNRANAGLRVLGAMFPEVMVMTGLFVMMRDRVRGANGERGDAVQWVILAAVGAVMAITVGTIIYDKIRTKATGINTDTPTVGTP